MSLPISPVVRAILTDDIDLSADDVIERAKARGVTASDDSIRMAVHNIKSALKKAAKKPAAKKPAPVPTAARKATAPAAEVVPAVVRVPLSPAPELAATLANVALVNAVVGACGGAGPARQAAEAVRACGGVEAFLQHLELVAGIRAQATAG